MKALVTGGGGFLGKAVVHQLVERGDEVRSFSRGRYGELDALGVDHRQGDLGDYDAVRRAVSGSDIVFHVGAKPGSWGRYRDFYTANVLGTKHVIRACREEGIPRLVSTSSPSVIFDDCDMEGADESVPYPKKYHSHYPRTKAIAERLVIAANSPELATVSLRPHMIWGPGDNHIIPGILARARSGRFRIVGGGEKVVDTVYVDNAALAHLQAADALLPGSAPAGRCYFITQGEPVRIIDMINGILDAAGVPRVTRTISPRAAYCAGALLEGIYRILPLPGEPMITRFLALELSRAHWFSIDAARRDFGYSPVISLDEGFRRLRENFWQG